MRTSRCTPLFALAALLALAAPAFAQGVGVNATGAAADTSALLDVSSTTKGLLVPRMTALQRASIVLPAAGLVVFQTDGTAGLWYNAGTAAVANWQLVGAGATAGQWSVSGANLYFSTGKVAVGTTPTGYRFTVQDTGSVFRVTAVNAGGVMASFGGAGQIQVDAPGVFGGRLALLDNGNLGLGVANPTNKLSFAPLLGKKISLYPGATGDVGFAVAGNRLQIYSDNPNADVALGYDAAGTFNERFAFKPTGAMAVNGNTGAAGQVLTSNGGNAATWSSPTSGLYANTKQAMNTTAVTVSPANLNPVLIPGMSVTFSPTTASRVLIAFTVPVISQSCFACGDQYAIVDLFDNGFRVDRAQVTLTNGEIGQVNGNILLDLTAGTHYIELDAVPSAGNGITFGNWGTVFATMTAQLLTP
jgi:hypothetical protein